MLIFQKRYRTRSWNERREPGRIMPFIELDNGQFGRQGFNFEALEGKQRFSAVPIHRDAGIEGSAKAYRP